MIGNDHDPLGLDPIAQVARITNPRSDLVKSMLRQGLVTRDCTVVDCTRPAVVSGLVGDDGKTLTLEDRQRIADERAPYDPRLTDADRLVTPDGTIVYLDRNGDRIPSPAYHQDLQDRVVEPIGATAQKVVDANPMFRKLPTRNDLVLTPNQETVIHTIPGEPAPGEPAEA